MTDFNTQVIEEFRANGGKVGGPFEGAELVLMTTTGAKSGKPHTNPVVYFHDGDRIYVIASAAGAPKHPAWYHNLVANPDLTVEVGTDKYQARATSVDDDAERDRLYANAVSVMPGFAEYEQKTSRRIPVVYLDRV
ncbi:nitroreductase family deazaflavin-dependent oxidoreductase [Kutzneria buriramensis]|uniref:Deazaflavin-dependent oxidoreductase (Nitroreductase family) n=1 Tax=Kutzneria buriramensis TaxID=1045776 RepID=A0A3E0I509_9PSEU|nr:nitroreductase family deazaflavin-dependent oxidoreductase [Kutzneria buriramensis]REH53799.1 deazaflavin-dependent oxidoreductase (nitroreductase family) [Kutzneria buriramensis]